MAAVGAFANPAGSGIDDAAVVRVDRDVEDPAVVAVPVGLPRRAVVRVLPALPVRAHLVWPGEEPPVERPPAAAAVHRLVNGRVRARVQRAGTPGIGGQGEDVALPAGPLRSCRAPVLATVGRLEDVDAAARVCARGVDDVRAAGVERERLRPVTGRERRERRSGPTQLASRAGVTGERGSSAAASVADEPGHHCGSGGDERSVPLGL